jgi:hypothetical protein
MRKHLARFQSFPCFQEVDTSLALRQEIEPAGTTEDPTFANRFFSRLHVRPFISTDFPHYLDINSHDTHASQLAQYSANVNNAPSLKVVGITKKPIKVAGMR